MDERFKPRNLGIIYLGIGPDGPVSLFYEVDDEGRSIPPRSEESRDTWPLEPLVPSNY